MFKLDTCCTLAPYFDVRAENLQAFKALGPKFVAKTRSDA
jgi:hypothetical protein